MANNSDVLKRPALGEAQPAGQLYCAWNESFMTSNLCGYGTTIPASYLATEDVSTTLWSVTDTDDIREKARQLGLSPEQIASFMSGMTATVKGSATYLSKPKASHRTCEASAICAITTKFDRLKLGSSDVLNSLPEEPVDTTGATHVLCGTQWGMNTLFVARTKSPGKGTLADIKTVLSSLNPNTTDSGSGSVSQTEITELANLLEFDIISDRIEMNNKNVEYAKVVATIAGIQDELKKVLKGKGYRVAYELKPLAEVAKALNLEAPSEPLISIKKQTLDRLSAIFADLTAAKQQLDDYLEEVADHRRCVPESQVAETNQLVTDLESLMKRRKPWLAELLKDVRRGNISVMELDKFLAGLEADRDAKFNMQSPSSVVKQYIDKMAFFRSLDLQRLKYMNDEYDGLKVDIADRLVTTYGKGKVHVIYYNARSTSTSIWPDTQDYVLALTQDTSNTFPIVLVDCDMGGTRPLVEPRIELRQGAEIRSYDVLRDVYALADKALLRCKQSEALQKVPNFIATTDTRPVKMSCPGLPCKSTSVVEWVCPNCKDAVCYNNKDGFMYCYCGKYDKKFAEFKCKHSTHGQDYIPASDTTQLASTLSKLTPYEEYNILILGETGIGKSTFINMFMNFLTFDTLEEACAYPGPVRCAIPGTFFQETKDKENYKTGSFKVQFGVQDAKEQESSEGQSATQEASSYAFVANGKIIRLIDTPGIGDTRGLTKDYENVDNVMKLLQSVDKLSAILFLLQPDKARLTPTFDFCLTELLTHLHKNSTKNLVFGFPRAVGTNFMLGDARAPLLKLLSDRKTGVTKLDELNTFFFDGDCFKHLAVFKQERMHMDDYKRCKETWEASRDNLRRLMSRSIELPTHAVAETLTLNRTRTIVLNMNLPITQITNGISSSKNMIQQQLEKIRIAREKGESIRNLLDYNNVTAVRTELKGPRTVCAAADCQTTETDTETGVSTTVYSSVCHEDCQIVCVDGQLNLAELRDCTAFDSNLNCSLAKCKHPWSQHMHIRYDIQMVTTKISNQGNRDKLTDARREQEVEEKFKADMDATLKNYEIAEQGINEALAIFGVYLFYESTVTYNDATEKYLDTLESQASKDGKLALAREMLERKRAYSIQRDKIKAAVDKKDQQKPDQTVLSNTFERLTKLPEVGAQFSQIIGPVTLTGAPDTFTLRLRTRPTGTYNYPWFKSANVHQVVIQR